MNSNKNNLTTDNGVLGPSFLEGLTEHIQNPIELHSHEWRRKLKASSGQTKFKIKFYGQIHEEYKQLIIRTDFAPSLIFAVDISNGQEILLFDGCKHGYDNLIWCTYTEEQIKNRQATNYYKDNNGNEIFEIIISTYNGLNYEEDFQDDADENGLIELKDGSKVDFEFIMRNAYDTLQIWAIYDKGQSFDCVAEELA